ncbi:Dual specificity protein phosphatase 10 [Mortierella sp. GBA30]|nr:Dual specificity protein phosphatase 10 [Mortierella sp. GBA30]
MPPHSLCASSCESNSHPYLVSSPPSLQQPVQSFSLHRPSPTQDMKKIRNAKQLSLNVSATPGQHTANTSHNNSSINGPAKKNTILPLIITPSPLFPPSTPSSTSFSSRRPFTPAPLTSIPRTTVSETKRHSQLLLDDALPTPKLPLPTTGATGGHRSISAYFSDYSLECGVASPYTSEPVCVLPNLYLGAEHNATDVRTLRRLGITFVLNVAIEIAQEEESDTMKSSRRIDRISGGVQYKSLPWTHHQKSLLRDFPTAFRLLDEAMVSHSGKGKALVHCQLGVSRSASLVIAYVMKSQGMGLTEAYDFVKLRSGVISPNMSLMYQLAEFEKTLKNPNWIPSDSASDSASIRSRNSWSSQLDDDEPPYPFSAAFSAAASPDSVPASVSLKLSSDPYMEIPATPSFRQEFCKRPLTPESVEEDHPNTKPFQGPGRMAQPMSGIKYRFFNSLTAVAQDADDRKVFVAQPWRGFGH